MHCGDHRASSRKYFETCSTYTSKKELHTEEVWLVSYSGLEDIKMNVKFTHYRLTASHNQV